MSSLEKMISSNLEMLEEQEAQILKSLKFIEQAKKLFQLQSNGTAGNGKRGRPTGSISTPKRRRKKKISKRKVQVTKKKPARKAIKSKRPGYMTSIVSILKEKKKPIASGELIDTLFKQQSKDKNIKHFRTLIYPALTNAYKSGKLKLKDKLIHLAE